MSISTYSDLVSAITEWLARENDATLVARIPDFIVLCEAKLNRELYSARAEKRSYTTFDTSDSEPEFVSLPDDFQSMRRVRLSSVDGKPQVSYKSQVQLDEYRYGIGNTAGQPRYFTIFGSEMEFCPTPDSNYTLEMVYRATISGLSASNTTNWLLTFAPDVYLYGALLESAPYIKDDARIQVWGSGLASALESLNRASLTMQFNSQPLTMTPSGATP